jgi:hypothetical protein
VRAHDHDPSGDAMARLFEARRRTICRRCPATTSAPRKVSAVVTAGEGGRRYAADALGLPAALVQEPHGRPAPDQCPRRDHRRETGLPRGLPREALSRAGERFLRMDEGRGRQPPAVVFHARGRRAAGARRRLAGVGAGRRGAGDPGHRDLRGLALDGRDPPPRAGEPCARGLGEMAGRGGQGRRPPDASRARGPLRRAGVSTAVSTPTAPRGRS